MPLDLELVNQSRFKPDPPSALELDAISKLDPVDYSVYTRRLEMACRESREVLKRLGISGFIRAGDTAHGIYTANGDLAIADVGTYLHVVDGIIPIKFVLKHYLNDGTVGVRDGDIFFCNEAVYGGIHNPDMITFMPVYADGVLVAWVAAASHEPETGATEPGGMPNLARSRYDEGLKSPPIKIGEDFRLKRDLIELLENNVRYPLMITNDQAARVAACLRLRQRVLEIADRKGVGFLRGTLRKIILDTAHSVQERIKRIPDGVFKHVAFIDTIGFDEGLVRLPITLTKQNDKMIFDLTQASPQVPGSYNAFEHMVEAHLAVILFQYFLNDIPASAGCLVPFQFKTTSGSCLNARHDAAVSNVTYLVPVVVSGMQLLMIKALYSIPEYRKDEYISLPLSGGLRSLILSGKNQWKKDVTNFFIAISNSRGTGGRHDKDGVDSAGFWFCGYAEALDCEQDESMYPVITLWRSYAVDCGGPGKNRGGTGVSFAYLLKNTEHLLLTGIGTGHKFPISHGVFGGYPASTRPLIIFRKAVEKLSQGKQVIRNDIQLAESLGGLDGFRVLPNANPTTVLYEGDLVAQCSGGGGGYGDVLERDPNLVIKDLRLGKISHWASRNVYKVIYDAETQQVDLKATEEERDRARKERLVKGKPYQEFLPEWLKRKPPEDVLRFYGQWPTPPAD